MLTVGRLSWKVRLLNFTTITIQERTNAELYYLGRIAKEMAEVMEGEEEGIIARQHPRWNELCKAHGKPIVNRNPEANRQSLGKSLISEFKVVYHMAVTLNLHLPSRHRICP